MFPAGRIVVEFSRRQPWMGISLILITLIVLQTGNAALLAGGYALETPRVWFPISVFPGSPSLHWNGLAAGLSCAVVFLLVLFLSIRFVDQLPFPWMLALAIALLVLGNMIQGTVSSAFLNPFTSSDVQYYHDAVKISAPLPWLRAFNDTQASLNLHSCTHPPFAVLIHWLFYSIGGTAGLAVAFTLFSFAQIPLFYVLAKTVIINHFEGTVAPAGSAKALTLLYVLLPAVNIYSVISLDAVIAVTFLCALLGLVLTDRRLTTVNLAILVVGFCAANALTFGGIYLAGLLGILALYRAVRNRSYNLLFGAVACGACAFLLALVAFLWFGYDHVQAFLTATRLENPQGFRLLADPVEYLGTRVEGVSEILLFLGVGVLATLLRQFHRAESRNTMARLIGKTGIAVCLLMFISGTFRTGETARCCLFIYPYLLMFSRGLSLVSIKDMAVWAGVQTAYMQTIGNYFW
jgi:hypothetical protein